MLTLDVGLWLLAAMAPGAGLIRLCWSDAGALRTIACAPAVSFGFCYAAGLGSSQLSLSPVLAVLVATAVLVFGVLAVEVRRHPSALRGRPISWLPAGPLGPRVRVLGHRPAAQLVSWLLFAAGVVLGVFQWRSFQSTMLVPVGWDAMHHGYFIEQISRYHTVSSSVVLSSDATGHDGTGTFYPLAFNLVAAVLHTSTGGLISTMMLASTTALAGVLLPLGTFALARELDPEQPLVAGFSAITSVLPLMLYLIEGTGRLTGILGVALVPGLVVLLLSQRHTMRWSRLPLAILGIVGIVGLHTSEAPLAALMAGVCMLVWPRQGGDWAGFRRWLIWVVAAGAAGVVALVVLEPDVLRLVSERGGAITPPTHNAGSQALDSALAAVGKAWVLPVAGCAVTLLRPWRRYLGAAIALVLFALLYYFVAIGTKTVVPTLAIPWYGDPGRISWDLTVLGAIPTAVGVVAIAGLVGSAGTAVAEFVAGADRSSSLFGARLARWTSPLVAAFTGLLLVVAFALPSVGRQGRLVSQVVGPVDQNSMAAFRYLATHVGPDERVLDDLRSDGAMWMYVDYGATPLFGSSPLLGAAPRTWLEKLWLSRNLNSINTDPCVRQLMAKYSIRYVYVGELHIYDGWGDFSVSKMRNNPAFTEVFRQGRAHVFMVDQGSAPGTCSRDVTARIHWG